MSFKTVKINDEKVYPIPLKKLEPKKIKGYELFPELYANIFLCARKKRGKTNCIFKILKNCVGKYTDIVIFSSTVHKDPNMKHIIKYFKKKHNVKTFTSIKEEKVDRVNEFLDLLKGQDEDDGLDAETKPKLKFISVDDSDDESEKKKKEKKIAPEIIFIFDDLGKEMNTTSVNKLLKTNRHYKSKVILSSQYPNDLSPEARKQIDYCILFSCHSIEKLQTIYDNFNINIPFETFIQLYEDATKKKYNFLYIDVNEVKFRKNFDYEYIL